MAMIKCPECGHDISNKAPFCPSCGAPIAGKVIQDQQSEPSSTKANGNGKKKHSKAGKSNKVIIVVSLIFAFIVCGVCFYFYNTAKNDKENEAYEYAMTSKDLTVLNGYLDTYPDAPQEHRDSISAHIAILQQADQDWTNAMVSGSISAIEQYLRQHPDSPYKLEALKRIDSLDWVSADNANTLEAVEAYIEQHPNGSFVDEATEKVKDLNSTVVQDEERQMITSLLATFLQSLNNKDEDALTSTVSPLMKTFLGKGNATRSDVATFMHKIYKSNVVRMEWTSLADYKIAKKKDNNGNSEFAVTFSATQQVENTDNTVTLTKYRIMTTVSAEGRICELNMTKILE